jgi:hypothetical protein
LCLLFIIHCVFMTMHTAQVIGFQTRTHHLQLATVAAA